MRALTENGLTFRIIEAGLYSIRLEVRQDLSERVYIYVLVDNVIGPDEWCVDRSKIFYSLDDAIDYSEGLALQAEAHYKRLEGKMEK